MSYVKIGVAGPVGSGKTALIEALSRKMAKDYSIGVITNDIYTKEDAQFLAKNSVLPVERIIGVETGGCPHTAIREDASMNLEAVDEMMERFPDIELLFIESGGDNLSATFSPELVDATIFVIDVAEGDKIPRKGGPARFSRRTKSRACGLFTRCSRPDNCTYFFLLSPSAYL